VTQTSTKTTQSFNAEIKQLLDIVIHSLYSQKEIFLRELISNASDALDKLKFQSLTHPELIADNSKLEIRLTPNASAHTLEIKDNGIGMSPEEVKDFIGTIAKSGTKAFSQLQQSNASGDLKSRPELIGQFGVGFYSAFMVADRVTLQTQKAGTTEGTIWESTGDGTYTLENTPRPEGHGTTITLHLKKMEENKNEDGSVEAAQDFADSWTLKSLVKKYSDFVAWPIRMLVEKQVENKDTKEKETIFEDETLNSQKALWLRPASEIKPEEYKEFYHHISHDWQEPAKWTHFKAEGTTEFSALFYIPSKKPWNYMMKDYEYGLSLYIKRVFIMENCKDLLPPYLRFVKGLVDSSDLSLNVSRELLQQDRLVTQIRKNIVTKVFSTLKDWLAKDRPAYEKFWTEFGTTLKEGIPMEPAQTEKLQDVLLFKSTFKNTVVTDSAPETSVISAAFTTLDEYVGRMKPTQKEIYFITGDRLDAIEHSPYLEKLKEKNYEVLLLTDAVDEWVTQGLTEFKGKKLVSITKEGLDLDTEEEKKEKETVKKAQSERFSPLMDKMKSALTGEVKDVVISDRLTETPVCLVSGQHDMSAHMQKILSQMGEATGNIQAPDSKRILEINPNHRIFEAMLSANEDQVKNWSEILYNQALLSEGNSLPNPSRFSKLISDLMVQANKH